MIYEFIKQGLQSLAALAATDDKPPKIFPVSANIDEVDGAFAVYTFKSSTPTLDLEGNIHHYEEDIDVDFVGPTYDELHAIYRDALKVLTVSNLDTGGGEYLFSSVCSSDTPEAFDPDSGLYRRSMRVNISWCLDENG